MRSNINGMLLADVGGAALAWAAATPAEAAAPTSRDAVPAVGRPVELTADRN